MVHTKASSGLVVSLQVESVQLPHSYVESPKVRGLLPSLLPDTKRVPGPSRLRNPRSCASLREDNPPLCICSRGQFHRHVLSTNIRRLSLGKAIQCWKGQRHPYLPCAHTDDKQSMSMQPWHSDLTHQTAVGPTLLEKVIFDLISSLLVCLWRFS